MAARTRNIRDQARAGWQGLLLTVTLLLVAALSGCGYTGAAQGWARGQAALAIDQKAQVNDDYARLTAIQLCDTAIGGMDQWSTQLRITALRECLTDTDELEAEMLRQMMQRMQLEAPGV